MAVKNSIRHRFVDEIKPFKRIEPLPKMSRRRRGSGPSYPAPMEQRSSGTALLILNFGMKKK